MSNQQAIDEALDALEIENEVVVEEVIEEVVEETQEVEPEDPIEEVAANPPGYINNIDDWIAAGKDPKLFKSPVRPIDALA